MVATVISCEWYKRHVFCSIRNLLLGHRYQNKLDNKDLVNSVSPYKQCKAWGKGQPSIFLLRLYYFLSFCSGKLHNHYLLPSVNSACVYTCELTMNIEVVSSRGIDNYATICKRNVLLTSTNNLRKPTTSVL